MKGKEYWKNYFRRKLDEIENSKKLSENNKRLLTNFLKDKWSEGVGCSRLVRVSEVLIEYAQNIKKDLDKVTEKDLRRYITELENNRYAGWTKYTYKVIIRNFYKSLNDGELPKMCKFMNMSLKGLRSKKPDDIWSEQEVNRLVASTNDLFWKAYISLGFESGARIGELQNLKVKNIHFNNFGARLRLDGKTGVREIPIVKAIPHISAFLRTWHPEPNNPEAWVWLLKNRKKVSDATIRNKLWELAKKIGIKKKSNPHLVFRHSRATQLANYLTESQLKAYFGWSQDSKMASVYIHLSGKDLDNAVLGIYGKVKKEEVEVVNNVPTKCPRCDFSNEYNAKFCINCGLALDIKTAMVDGKNLEEANKHAESFMNSRIGKEAFFKYLDEWAKEKGLIK